MKKFYLIHGFESLPNRGFMPWLMSNLWEKEKAFAVSLAMPSPELPKVDEWVDKIVSEIQDPSKEIYLVGHSLGVPAILRYLETLDYDKKIGGAFLVAGFCNKLNQEEADSNIRKIDNFFEKSFDFERIKKVCDKFFIIHGSDDKVVPISNAEFLAKQLDSKVLIVNGAGHFPSSKVFELPELLEVILQN